MTGTPWWAPNHPAAHRTATTGATDARAHAAGIDDTQVTSVQALAAIAHLILTRSRTATPAHLYAYVRELDTTARAHGWSLP